MARGCRRTVWSAFRRTRILSRVWDIALGHPMRTIIPAGSRLPAVRTPAACLSVVGSRRKPVPSLVSQPPFVLPLGTCSPLVRCSVRAALWGRKLLLEWKRNPCEGLGRGLWWGRRPCHWRRGRSRVVQFAFLRRRRGLTLAGSVAVWRQRRRAFGKSGEHVELDGEDDAVDRRRGMRSARSLTSSHTSQVRTLHNQRSSMPATYGNPLLR